MYTFPMIETVFKPMIRVLSIAALSLVLSLGCADEPEAGDDPSLATTAAETDLERPDESVDGEELMVEVGPDLLLDSAIVGVVENGEIRSSDTVAGDDQLAIRMTATEVPVGLVARVEWKQGDDLLAEEQKPVPPSRTVEFGRPAGLEPGSYTVELFFGGDLVHTAEIEIE